MSIIKKVYNKLNNTLKYQLEYSYEKQQTKNNPSPRISYCGLPIDIISAFTFNGYLPEKYKNYRNSIYKPFLEYFSVFEPRNKCKKSKAKYKIFWTGEDVVVNFTDFSDHCLPDCDLALGFIPEGDIQKQYQSKYIRYPLWLMYYFSTSIKNAVLTKDKIVEIVNDFNSKRYEKSKFCALVAGHDRSGIRAFLKEHLSTIEQVKSAGSFSHNDDSLVKDFGNNQIEYLKQFMFNICPENASTNGYVTEKLFQSFDAGCIPIYNGGGNYLEPEVVNQNALILYRKNCIEDTVSQVKELWTNKTYYNEFINQPRLLDTAPDFIYSKLQETKEKFLSIIE